MKTVLVHSMILYWVCGLVAVHAAESAPRAVPLAPPAITDIPDGPLGDSIKYGQSIVNQTQTTVKSYVGNGLQCTQCHIDGGRTAWAAPLVGLTGLFPAYRARSGAMGSLSDRLNDCFERSMNGKPLPLDSPEMIGLLAYISWLSEGVPVGTEVEGRGFQTIEAPATVDAANGKAVFAAKCSSCHGANGEGIKAGAAGYAFPPLWGEDSFNDGAGMARLSVAAAFVKAKMPVGAEGQLTIQEAYDVAAFFTAQPRPVYPGKSGDWPNGGKPEDAR